MKKKKDSISLTKVIAIVLALAVILMLALFVMGRASAMSFWIAMIAAAVVAYFIIPPLKEKEMKAK